MRTRNAACSTAPQARHDQGSFATLRPMLRTYHNLHGCGAKPSLRAPRKTFISINLVDIKLDRNSVAPWRFQTTGFVVLLNPFMLFAGLGRVPRFPGNGCRGSNPTGASEQDRRSGLRGQSKPGGPLARLTRLAGKRRMTEVVRMTVQRFPRGLQEFAACSTRPDCPKDQAWFLVPGTSLLPSLSGR